MDDQQLLNGAYFSETGETMHATGGAPLLYLDDATGTYRRYRDGRTVYYFDLFGEHLNRMPRDDHR